jgi:hypothetical protein
LPDESFNFAIIDEDTLADFVKWQAARVVCSERIWADIHCGFAFAEPEETKFTEALVFHASCLIEFVFLTYQKPQIGAGRCPAGGWNTLNNWKKTSSTQFKRGMHRPSLRLISPS